MRFLAGRGCPRIHATGAAARPSGFGRPVGASPCVCGREGPATPARQRTLLAADTPPHGLGQGCFISNEGTAFPCKAMNVLHLTLSYSSGGRRSEERRVGKECRSQWEREQRNNKKSVEEQRSV